MSSVVAIDLIAKFASDFEEACHDMCKLVCKIAQDDVVRERNDRREDL
jgi:hypothetical protein